MKVVINTCFGGFGLSPKALEMYVNLKGETAYFFANARDKKGNLQFSAPLVPVEDFNDPNNWVVYVYTTPNPTDEDESLSGYDVPRDDPDLVATVEALGAEANGRHAELKVIEVPDDVEWFIDEYDGREHVAEKHRSWA